MCAYRTLACTLPIVILQVPLSHIFQAYKAVLPQHGITAAEDTFFYRLLITLSLRPESSWWAKLDAERQRLGICSPAALHYSAHDQTNSNHTVLQQQHHEHDHDQQNSHGAFLQQKHDCERDPQSSCRAALHQQDHECGEQQSHSNIDQQQQHHCSDKQISHGATVRQLASLQPQTLCKKLDDARGRHTAAEGDPELYSPHRKSQDLSHERHTEIRSRPQQRTHQQSGARDRQTAAEGDPELFSPHRNPQDSGHDRHIDIRNRQQEQSHQQSGTRDRQSAANINHDLHSPYRNGQDSDHGRHTDISCRRLERSHQQSDAAPIAYRGDYRIHHQKVNGSHQQCPALEFADARDVIWAIPARHMCNGTRRREDPTCHGKREFNSAPATEQWQEIADTFLEGTQAQQRHLQCLDDVSTGHRGPPIVVTGEKPAPHPPRQERAAPWTHERQAHDREGPAATSQSCCSPIRQTFSRRVQLQRSSSFSLSGATGQPTRRGTEAMQSYSREVGCLRVA